MPKPIQAAGPSVPLASARSLVLAKQGLAGPGWPAVLPATEAAVGIYSSAPTCYLSYAARVAGFKVGDLDDELYRHRRLVRARCMHDMAYIVTADSLPMIAAAVGADERAVARLVGVAGLMMEDYARLSGQIEDVLAGVPSATVPELRELLGPHAPPRRNALNYVVQAMCREYRLVRADVRGTWRSNSYAYAPLASWLGSGLTRADPDAARADLARRYLAAYGPATFGDLRWWAGWTVRLTQAALATLDDEVTQITLTGTGTADITAMALARDLEALAAADPGGGRGVHLLPVWDALMMGYERGGRLGRLVPWAHYDRVYDESGNGTSVVLVDGVAAGVWELEHDGTLAVRLAPFGNSLRARWVEATEAAAGLAVAVGATDLRIECCDPPGPLASGASNAYLRPISLGSRG
jgi:hypothetical protein